MLIPILKQYQQYHCSLLNMIGMHLKVYWNRFSSQIGNILSHFRKKYINTNNKIFPSFAHTCKEWQRQQRSYHQKKEKKPQVKRRAYITKRNHSDHLGISRPLQFSYTTHHQTHIIRQSEEVLHLLKYQIPTMQSLPLPTETTFHTARML